MSEGNDASYVDSMLLGSGIPVVGLAARSSLLPLFDAAVPCKWSQRIQQRRQQLWGPGRAGARRPEETSKTRGVSVEVRVVAVARANEQEAPGQVIRGKDGGPRQEGSHCVGRGNICRRESSPSSSGRADMNMTDLTELSC